MKCCLRDDGSREDVELLEFGSCSDLPLFSFRLAALSLVGSINISGIESTFQKHIYQLAAVSNLPLNSAPNATPGPSWSRRHTRWSI